MIAPTLLQQSTPTPGELADASADLSSAFGDSGALLPFVLFVVYAVATLLAAQFVAPWLAGSSFLGTGGNAVTSAIAYAIKGVAAVAVLGLAALPAYFALTVDAGTRGLALRWVTYGLAAFAGLVVVGWLADRAVSRYIDAHPDVESWAELWESDDGDSKEVVADGGGQE